MRTVILLAWLAGSATLLPCAAQDSPALPVTEGARACRIDADCVTVYTRCDSCDCPVAISRAQRDRHVQRLQAICAAYTGPHCDKLCPLELPACVAGRCSMVPG